VGRTVSRQETVAQDLELAAADVAAFIEDCPDRIWSSVAPRDGRTVASLAYHCAAGNDLALGWICQILSYRPVHETAESHNGHNDDEAIRSADVRKAEVSTMLRRTTERAAHFLRSLTDDELERHSVHGIAGREVTVGQFISNFPRHIRGHLEAMNEAAAALQG
jgi:hypothetical protein